MSHQTLGYRADIDGLRMIAVLSVVVYHAFPALAPGGFIGVDIFFVISGFLITGILVRELQTSGRIDLAEFYARRVRRLLPALLGVILATLALGVWRVPATGELQSLAWSALSALFFVSNIFFALQPSGYFAGAAETYPLLHTWTLAVEEQFYLVWPLLIPAACWIGGKLGLRARPALWVLFGAVFVLSLALSVAGTIWRPTFAFYLTPFRGWEFAIGALLSLAMRGDRPRWHHGATMLSLAGLALIGAAIWTIDHDTPFPGWIALLPASGAAAMLAGGAIAPRNPVARLLATPPAVYVGRLSYGWYLWHWPLLALVRGDALGTPSQSALLAAVALSFLFSALSYHLIELPVRRQSWAPFRGTGRALLTGGAILATGGLACLIVLLAAPQMRAASPRLTLIAGALAAESTATIPKACMNYEAVFSALAPPAACTIGDTRAPRLIYLIGDSHAQRLLPMLDRWGRQTHVAILQRARGGCRPLEGDAVTIGLPPTRAFRAECGRFRDAVFAEARALAAQGRVSAIMVVSRWPDADVPITITGSAASSRHGMAIGFERLARLAADAGVRLVMARDTPLLPHAAPTCLARRSVADCSVSRAQADRQRDEGTRALIALNARHPGVRLFDPSVPLCDAMTCSPLRDGRLSYVDDSHLSTVGSIALADPLSPALDKALFGR